MRLPAPLERRLRRRPPPAVIVRQYGRDSLLVWANALLGPVLAALGLRVGLLSEERVARLVERDAAAMRARGYLVSRVETFSLPLPLAPDRAATWHRVTYERVEPAASHDGSS